MDTAELTKEVESLKLQLQEVQALLTNVGMSYDMKEIIRNEVIKGEDPLATTTRVVNLGDGEITIPVNPSGVLVFKWRAKEYKIPYV